MTPASPAPSLVVPVKTLSRAKQRLHGHPRAALMRAFALDALTAALACPRVGRVHVVTDEQDLVGPVERLGATVLPDEGTGDLNAALRAAARRVPPGPVGVLLGDLPCLRPEDLAAALNEADGGGGRAHVPDAEGTGTTLLLAPTADALTPRFGPGSAARHREAGYAAVGFDLPHLRRDVDTADDLADAIHLGLGAHTAAVLGPGSGQPQASQLR